jgi:hypothetical protein
VGNNPPDYAQIRYFLPKRHTFGKMTMDVMDMEGNVVAKLEPGKQKGINTVDWYFNSKAPKSAKGKTLDGASLFTPRVKAGKYKVRVTKGSDVFEQEITTVYDPKSPFTLEERATQQKVTKENFDFVQDLAYFVYQLDTWIASAEAAKKKDTEKGSSADRMLTGLRSIKDKCVITKGDNYVGQGEKQLREKLGDIYSNIGSYYGAPSTSQMENVQSLRDMFSQQKAAFDKLKSTELKKFESELTKQGLKLPEVKSFEDFLKDDQL